MYLIHDLLHTLYVFFERLAHTWVYIKWWTHVLQDANDIVNKFEELQEEVERRYNQSIQDVLAANSSLTIAQQLHNDTNQVTVQELKGELF